MAGLWDASTRDDGSGIEPCAVITVPANAVMNVIDGIADSNDGRMPAVLTREDQEVWLHGTVPLSVKAAFACLKPYSNELTIAYPVSTRVNSTRNNDAGLVEEITVEEITGQ